MQHTWTILQRDGPNRLELLVKCRLLEVVSRHEPKDQSELIDIMNLLETRLKSTNCGVILAITKVFLHLTVAIPKLHKQVRRHTHLPHRCPCDALQHLGGRAAVAAGGAAGGRGGRASAHTASRLNGPLLARAQHWARRLRAKCPCSTCGLSSNMTALTTSNCGSMQVFTRLRAPIITHMNSADPELAFSCLQHVKVLVDRNPEVFIPGALFSSLGILSWNPFRSLWIRPGAAFPCPPPGGRGRAL